MFDALKPPTTRQRLQACRVAIQHARNQIAKSRAECTADERDALVRDALLALISADDELAAMEAAEKGRAA